MSPATLAACPSENDLVEFAHGSLDPSMASQVEEHLADCPDCCSLLDALGSTVRPRGDHASPGGDEALALEEVPPSRYRLRRELARGGMGCIYEAWDTRHARAVAIKMMIDDDAEHARRFAREARITARLSHPTIVPLYEAGRWSGGEPFFAMKLVVGRSLGDVIAETTTLAERLALLPHLVAVIDALAYAHGQGVVHRDLKPGNVLVGAFGETVVIDWGLAKEAGVAGDEAPRREGGDVGPALTAFGQAIGTPCYMPPEQARGEAVDARADVYALGAMLHHLVAGEPPHLRPTTKETIQAVLDGPPPPLAERAPGAPADLVTLIEKAMARAPDDRYPTAAAMADDLRRFMNGQLVSAHAYGLGALLRRWAARHRAIVAMTALLVVALGLVGGVSVWRIVRERDRADAAKAVAAEEERVALVQRDASEELIQYLLTTLRNRLRELNRLDVLQGLGAEVVRYYDVASPEGSLDAPRLARRADALMLLAEVELRKKNTDAAQKLFGAAERLLERAASLAPKDAKTLNVLADVRVQLAGLALDREDYVEAERLSRSAMDSAREIVDGDPAGIIGLRAYARAELRLALGLRYAGRAAETLPLYDDACAMLERASAAAPDDVETKRRLGWAYFERADARFETRDLDGAARGYEESLRVREALAATEAGPQWKTDVAWADRKLADVSRARGDFARAVVVARDATAQARAIWNDDPANLESARDVASGLVEVAEDETALERWEEAIADAREARSIMEKTAHDAANQAAEGDLAQTEGASGHAELGAGKWADARTDLSSARRHAEREIARAHTAALLIQVDELLVRADAALHDAAAAKEDATRARVDAERTKDTLSPEHDRPLAALRVAVAAAYAALAEGNDAEAERGLGDVLRAYDAAPQPTASERIDVSVHAEILAGLRMKRHDGEAARDAWRRVVALLEPIDAAHPLPPKAAARLARARAATR